MTKREWKRLLLCLCVLIATAVGFVLWGSRSGSPTLSISFIGYTNRPSPAVISSYYGANSTNAIVAVLRATNSGPVTLRLWSVYPIAGQPPTFPGGLPRPAYSGTILRPGEWASVELFLPPKIDSWSVQADFTHWGPWQRAAVWVVGNSGSSTIRKWIERVVPWQEVSSTQCAPITNQPAGGTLNR